MAIGVSIFFGGYDGLIHNFCTDTLGTIVVKLEERENWIGVPGVVWASLIALAITRVQMDNYIRNGQNQKRGIMYRLAKQTKARSNEEENCW